MSKKQFKAESKRLLELMIGSIYTHKEIFLRELISNASDAIDKLCYRSLTDSSVTVNRDELEIRIVPDKLTRTLTVSDNGIGMTKEELENNLGTICKSGSLAFKQENEKKDDVDIIGQFGVGFYSAFMVADKVTVLSRAYGSEDAYKWESSGVDGYTVAPCDKEAFGTTVVLHIKPDSDEEKYEDYMETYEITRLVQRYSDYIRYPIRMAVEKSRRKEGSENEWEDYTTVETLNSMKPIWKKKKGEVTDEEYNAYYKEKFSDRNEPSAYVRASAEGLVSYDALLFIPSAAPYDFYTRQYSKGLQLYSNGVLIEDKCADLLPDCFGFVKGIVDSPNLSLNISREMLQHDRQLKTIAGHLEKKIKAALLSLLKDEREKYEKFYESFGEALKYGLYSSYGTKKELLSDLLMFPSSEGKNATLAEYRDRMKESQEFIYYASGQTADRLALLPQCEAVRAKGFEVLYFTKEVDEFAIGMIGEFDGKKFKNVTDSDVATDEEKEAAKAKADENKTLFEALKNALGDKVSEVRPSALGGDHPVCLRTEGEITFEMERMFNATSPDGKTIHATAVLEINTEHPLFEKLKACENDGGLIKKYAGVLYDQGRLIEGMPIDNPVEFSATLCELMSR